MSIPLVAEVVPKRMGLIRLKRGTPPVVVTMDA